MTYFYLGCIAVISEFALMWLAPIPKWYRDHPQVPYRWKSDTNTMAIGILTMLALWPMLVVYEFHTRVIYEIAHK